MIQRLPGASQSERVAMYEVPENTHTTPNGRSLETLRGRGSPGFIAISRGVVQTKKPLCD